LCFFFLLVKNQKKNKMASLPNVGSGIDYRYVLGWKDLDIEPGQEGYEQAVKAEIEKHRDCKDDECLVCAAVACPNGEPLHWLNDGCPVCSIP
jgi:hypothetical protein